MSFCQKCGTKKEDNDVFCGGCGSSFENSNINTDQNSKSQNFQKAPTGVISNINTEVVSKHSKEILEIVLNMFIKPISTCKDLIHKLDQTSTIILGAVLALIQGFFAIWKLHQLVSIVGGASGLFNPSQLLGFSIFSRHIKIPFISSFLHGVVFYIAVVGVMGIAIFAASKLLSKASINVLNIGKLVILATIPALAGEFLSTLISYFSPTLGILVLLLGILTTIVIVTMNMKELVDIDDDKLVYVTAAIFALVLFCALYLITKFLITDLSTIATSAIIGFN